jgi:2-keto-4-pentenoate hydratase/2-oxohepta-3-ene-1,7-dioic acid hydratase in catechol pathway
MKLVAYEKDRGNRLGLMLGEGVLDLANAFQALKASSQGGDEFADFVMPADMLSFLQSGEEATQAARATLEWYQRQEGQLTAQLETLDVSTLNLRPPLPNPGKIVCVGLNYLDHCMEQNIEIPQKPVLFAKFPSSVIGTGDPITWPAGLTDQVDYEAELAVIIGRKARQVLAEQAYAVVAGYTIVNDVSARDLQFGDGQWVRGKSLDTFCPMGPALVTRDEIPDPQDLNVQCWVDTTLMQNSNTRLMIFKIPELIEFITRGTTLYPGDVICTGTPDGVGAFRKPPIFLEAGNTVKVAIETLGELINPVV